MDKVNSVQELIERTRGMPLERMRFFINEDRQEPRCFGIYHDDEADRWVVYKNKDDGSRAVRYSGPDEGYAANELWMKLQSEIDIRRKKQKTPQQVRREKRINTVLICLLVALVIVYIIHEWRKPSRGYYLMGDDIYYYQDPGWYYYDDGWTYYDSPGGYDWYHDNYYGESYPYFDDYSDGFEYSDYYEEPDSSDSGSSDSDIFDSWDSGDTDWSSDW